MEWKLDGKPMSPELFYADKEYPFSFMLYPPEAKHDGGKDSLATAIIVCGGAVLSEPNEFTIHLIDDNFIFNQFHLNGIAIPKRDDSPSDLFSSHFVFDCIKKNKILKLRKYRFTRSKYERHNPNDILNRHVRWCDLRELEVVEIHVDSKESDVIENQCAQEASTDGQFNAPADALVTQPEVREDQYPHVSEATESEITVTRNSIDSSRAVSPIKDITWRSSGVMRHVASPPRGDATPIAVAQERRRTSRHSDRKVVYDTELEHAIDRVEVCPPGTTYTPDEDQIILQVLVKHNWYRSYASSSIWKWIEERRILARTWQSMRNRFIRHILPKIGKYNLTASQLGRFMAAGEQITQGRRRPAILPD